MMDKDKKSEIICGVGLSIRRRMGGKEVVCVHVQPSSSASTALEAAEKGGGGGGVREGDIVLQIDRKDLRWEGEGRRGKREEGRLF